MKNTLASGFVLLCLAQLFGPAAYAQSGCAEAYVGQGLISNVSSVGLASAQQPVTACTIIRAYDSVYGSTAFFAESDTGDAVLDVFFVSEPLRADLAGMWPFPAKRADNWGEVLTPGDMHILQSKLRLPSRPSDAALVLTSDENYYKALTSWMFWPAPLREYRFAVCAKGYPKTGTARVNVSITNVSDDACAAKGSRYFER